MNRFARHLVGQAVIVGYLLAVIGASLLHDHRSRGTEVFRSGSSIPHRSPGQNQTPLSDDHCLACQFYSAQSNIAGAVSVVSPAEIVGAVLPCPALPPAEETPTELLARGPPVLS